MESAARFVAVVSGTGSGKTYVGPIWLYEQITRNPTDSFLVAAPTYKMLRNATMPMLLSHFRGTKLDGEWKEGKGWYELPSGGVIYCVSVDDPYNIEGVHCRAAWCDEAGQYARAAWTVVQARLGHKLGRCLFTTTPYSLNWLKSEVYDRWKAGDADYDVVQFGSADSPWYPQEEVERARRTLPDATFRMRYLGEFARMEGLVFPPLAACVVDAPPKLRGDRYGGIDFGFRPHPLAAIGATLDRNDVLWLTSERYAVGSSMAEHVAALDKTAQWFADPSGPQWIDELGRAGFNIHKAPNDVALGVQAVWDRVTTGRLKIVRGACPNLLDEAESYHRDEQGKIVKSNDDACDATRYLCQGLRDRLGAPMRMRWL